MGIIIVIFIPCLNIHNCLNILAKNLKEIVDSVQGDLLKKLEELQAEQKALIPEKPLTIDYQKETF